MKCSNCGKEKKTVAKGLCSRCYGLQIEEQKTGKCPGCGERKPLKARGLCRKCYARFLRRKDPLHERTEKPDSPCAYCGAVPTHAKGFCSNCYARYLQRGSPERVKVRHREACSFCGKEAFLKAHGLCGACYTRKLRRGTVEYAPKRSRVRECVGCKKQARIVAKGLCSACYVKHWETGVLVGSADPAELELKPVSAAQSRSRLDRKNDLQRQRRKADKERYRNYDLKKSFGLSTHGYDMLLEEQDGRCAICGNRETASRNGSRLSLAVDHCHDSGKIRGLLCSNCNNGLGRFHDSPELLAKAVEYLRKQQP